MLIPTSSKKCWMRCAIAACRWRRSGHERFPFYDLVANVFAIAQTGELRPHGNFIFKKGAILGGAI